MMNTKVRLVRCPKCRQVLPELAELPVYKCGGCGAVLQAKKPKSVSVDETSGKPREGSSGDRKTDQVSNGQEAGSSLDQQSPANEPGLNSHHNEPRSSTELSSHEDPESSPEATAHNQLDHHQDHDEPHSSTKLSSHNDPESSPEAMAQDQEHKQDHEEDMFMENESELTESPEKFSSSEFAKTEIIKGSNGGSSSSFKSLIAEKLLDTRQKKASSNLNKNDELFGNASYYYEGSVSSFDGNVDRAARRSGPDWRHSRHRLSENPKLEKLELLKMVRELQDQLERTNVSSSYYNHVRRMAFSGEAAAVNRNHDSGTCYHCCPPDPHRHFSAQLPHQHVCCNGPHFGPQHHMGPEISVLARTERTTDNLRHRRKRHLRPVASGAAMVACYRCSEILELPQSFLVFKKRCHSLRCGACLKILNFTLSSGTHVLRYCPEETLVAPPSSEVEDYVDSSAPRVGPVSCSDRSFQKSYSTETEKQGSSERKTGTRVGLKDPSGSEKKTTTEIEEVEAARSSSPLHRLMGYASPSKVIRG